MSMKGRFDRACSAKDALYVVDLLKAGHDVRFRWGHKITRFRQNKHLIKFYDSDAYYYGVYVGNGLIYSLKDKYGYVFEYIEWSVFDAYTNAVENLILNEKEFKRHKKNFEDEQLKIEKEIETIYNAVQSVVDFDEFEIVKLIFSYF